ncbi:mitochondrial import inner membrane translocase subunit TIM44 [Lepeophtheirus salmonis]|uniref:Mitochondrial import inner membrane translocase subunit TIM44 n=2 Tax=Lepeophtheirus salmonis TaxID=72036 RepID=A0A0K2TNX3_LEPSM|nr:mitochondrial import inner membrane translocase subunit TIM44-like [Lepeophtheirus salmonis]
MLRSGLRSFRRCQYLGVRNYSGGDPGKRPSFFGNFVKNFKDEYSKDQKIQSNLTKFREEAKRLEESQALQDARSKFNKIEEETSGVLKDRIKDFSGSLEGSRKKINELGESVSKAAESVSKAAESIGSTSAFQKASRSASILKKEIEGSSLGTHVYSRPSTLRKRKSSTPNENITVDDTSTGVELHKDSKFFASWQSFKDSNPVFNRFVEARMKYEESDNPVVRGARVVTDKLHDILGGLFTTTELSQALTEIIKMDPNFCREEFLKQCERDIIPNILEAINQGDLEILEDWCFEAPFSVLATPIRQAKELGYLMESTVLDIDNVDLTTGMMMEQGPVLAITFNAQQILCVRDRSGKIIEGDPERVMRIMYIFVLCRDQTELDPQAAWRLLEVQARDRQEQYL